MFAHIIAPLDGSALAECALPHVAALAQTFGAHVSLVRVLEYASSGAQPPVDPVDWQMRRAEATAYLESVAERLSADGLAVETSLQEGRAAEALVDFVQQNGDSLVVLSSHGAGGLSRWNVSSVVHKILTRAPSSSLVVRAWNAPAERGPAAYHRLLVPLDGSQRAEAALSPAAALAASHDAELLLAHVVHVPPAPTRRTPLTDEEHGMVNRIVERYRSEAEDYLEQVAARLHGRVQTRLLVSSHVASALHTLADEEDADLVVMSAHGYTGPAGWPYGSVTASFIEYGGAPVLYVQDAAPGDLAPTRAELASALGHR